MIDQSAQFKSNRNSLSDTMIIILCLSRQRTRGFQNMDVLCCTLSPSKSLPAHPRSRRIFPPKCYQTLLPPTTDSLSTLSNLRVFLHHLNHLIHSHTTPHQPLTMKFAFPTTTILTALLLAHSASAGPAAYGICQAGCAALVTACYTAAGFTWGATMGVSVPATIIACNSAFGTCQAACWAALVAPTL
jgi:hypothetical protein